MYVCILYIFSLLVIDKITVTNYYNLSLSAPLLTEQNNGVITSRAKKRWRYLAYTLVRNPKLIELRRRDNQVIRILQRTLVTVILFMLIMVVNLGYLS